MADYLDELVQKITTRADLKGFDDLNRKQLRAIKQNDLLGKSFMRAFGFFFGIQGIRSVIQTSREIDLLKRAISGLTESGQDFEYLRKQAYLTGTDLRKTAGAYKNFYSAANKSGFKKDAIQGMFSDVLVAGRGIGANQQQIGGALLALEQMLSKGKVSMEELRRQMGNALPGAFEIAAKSMGVTTKEFNKMLEAGLDANIFVPRFTKMLRNELGKGFEANIKSLDYALVNFGNAWVELQANILQGDAGEALAQFVKEITAILRSQGLLRFIKYIGKGLSIVLKHIKEIALLWGFSKFIKLIEKVRVLDKAIINMAASTAALGKETRTLALAYKFLSSGKLLQGLGMLRAGLWSMLAPTLALGAQWAAIVAGILMVQDILLTFADPNADTYTRDLMNAAKVKPSDFDVIPESINSIGGPVRNNPYAGMTVADKAKAFEDLKKSKAWKNATIGLPTTPITDVQIPNAGDTGALSDKSHNNQNKQGVNNNITINITAPNSHPDTIAQSVSDALDNFFISYKMGYA